MYAEQFIEQNNSLVEEFVRSGWTQQTPGAEQPVDDETIVDVLFVNGERLLISEKASALNWSETGQFGICMFRISKT